jgi:tetratricopeptide (TPR) repeat protein
VQGRSQGPEADSFRDHLEQPWYSLTEAEQRRVDGLSEDLWGIIEPPARKDLNPQSRRGLQRALQAKEAHRLDEALELLRRWNAYFDLSLSSFLRGSIWLELGHPEVAAVFFKRAGELAPDDDVASSMYLHAISLFDLSAAISLAEQILSDPEHRQAGAVVQACQLLFLRARSEDAESAQSTASFIVATLTKFLPELMVRRKVNDFYPMALGIAAFASELAGDLPLAKEYYDEAIAVDPDNVALLTARGILAYGADSQATKDFQRAVDRGTRLVWPYFYLAHDAFVRGDFERCRRLIDEALACPAPDEVRANLYEWLGIVNFELTHSIEESREAFARAIALAPDDLRIRKNLRTLEATIGRADDPAPWAKPQLEHVQRIGQREFRRSVELRSAIAA